MSPLPANPSMGQKSVSRQAYPRPLGVAWQKQTACIYIKGPCLGFHWFICFPIKPDRGRSDSLLDCVINANRERYVFVELKFQPGGEEDKKA